MSDTHTQLIKRIYDRFNARDIDAVLTELADDVVWANGMDGGHVHGREAVRDYWTRQWAVVSPHVEPMAIQTTDDGVVAVEVIQSVFDLDGRPLTGQTHGLKDKTVMHIFRMESGKIVRFDIKDTP
ncbi:MULTISPECIES: nuclear transport factor 2 family protein [unclassified Rhizobium]|uniref:nuclear transport factor 2 family protein n=1 Tax=unclassified Rhizobium TaxID=2613769 RepID=UPI000CDF51D5|nr:MULTISPECIES: nuclear transport factor 2 family protein [Rhizobium]AVA22424.1 NTF2 domain-containing protein [Rhizobium sp. NXC24]MDK4738521.1 nuclear transport factor 2 family protein [Rhizobium sp. CNPSo 3464]UWU19859.1 nuclear transport factor 2 family protein [Rhizobium tropici]